MVNIYIATKLFSRFKKTVFVTAILMYRGALVFIKSKVLTKFIARIKRIYYRNTLYNIIC